MKSRNVTLNCGTAKDPVRAARSGRRFAGTALMLFALGFSALLTGCSANFDPHLTGADPSSAVGSLKGKVHGGQAPIYQAAVFLMQTGHSGYPYNPNTNTYAVANTSIIASGTATFGGTVNGQQLGNYVLTDVNGDFSIPSFTCTPGAGIYVYSVGGQPINGTTNSAATQMSPMGICPAGGAAALAASVPFINVNEVSTVAMAYALEGFTETGLDATHISSSSTNTVGLANAFGTAAAIYNVAQSGGANQTIPNQSTTTTVTYQTINTLANILAACINSNGSTATSTTPCYILFNNATSNGTSGGGTVPTDTASAAINIAHWPQSNVSALFALASNSYSPYTPVLGSAPSNFTVGITYSNSNLANVLGLEIDSAGYVYAASPVSPTGAIITGFTKISPYSGIVGTTSSAGFGLNNNSIQNFSLDTSNDLFVVASPAYGSTVTEYAPSTTSLLGSQIGSYTSSTYNLGQVLVGSSNNNLLLQASPTGGGNTFILNVPKVSGTYNPNSPSYTYGPTGVSGSLATVQDVFGTVLVSGFQQNFIFTEAGSTQTQYTNSTTTDSMDPLPFALNNLQNTIFTASTGNSLYSFPNSTAADRRTGGGMSQPRQVVIDGQQNWWVANAGACTISENNYTAHNGKPYGTWVYSNGINVKACTQNSNAVGGMAAVAVDPSGNVWTATYMPSTTLNGTTGNALQNGNVFEIVGLGAPTIQPFASLEAAGQSSGYDQLP